MPLLSERFDLRGGKVPLVVEPGRARPAMTRGFVEAVAAQLNAYRGKVAGRTFDHWLICDWALHARHSGRTDRPTAPRTS